MSEFRTALGRARGLGSAKHGVGHFIGQRVSAVALVLLGLWGAISAVRLSHAGYGGARAWLDSPLNAALLALLAVTGFFHVHLGARTIIEDYIARPLTKTALLILNTFVCAGFGALTVMALFKVASGGGAY
jgi:succinate dehydrogenase / fumarate reductase membrane anchor subunit